MARDQTFAQEIAKETRRLAEPFSADPAVQVTLAQAEYQAGKDDLCEQAADRALTKDPKNATALIYKGRVRLRRALVRKEARADVWNEARSWLIKANRLNPDHLF